MGRRLSVLLLLPFITAGCASADRLNDKAAATQNSTGRAMYSPGIKSDPYLQVQWDASARALEGECERSGRYCDEAKAARTAISRLPSVDHDR